MIPLVSICIPAYKNREFLLVLLNSIATQTFTDFEIIVTDDSPTNEVENVCKEFEDKFSIKYFKNYPPKGSPANWNAGIAKASGKWIKIMHDDDWFTDEYSLDKFLKPAISDEEIDFIFSGYRQYEDGQMIKEVINSQRTFQKLKKKPLKLFQKNYIGHPSTTLIKNNRQAWYDENLKWVVDFEFYIRCLKNAHIYFIPEALINIGVNNEQITKQVFRNIEVEIPENIYLIHKLGTPILKNIIVYDYYWRMFRNLNIRSVEEVTKYLDTQTLPASLIEMLNFQLKIPLSILKMGIFSKAFMALSYSLNSMK